ncbi:putative telomerase-associated protein [Trypanosoma conorhini]|uniref:Putative telomerase-associated protein n=1 Tax=Trypanosoma conorhini TaxID=83891 RepID=A0A3R7LM57_9TRYP|nr:putative telomerase-associated protein [Trypanosoma conorhini]RNF27382.1 putative telomerase-associated protein [Trypanosoma conorhini]
MTQQPGEEAKWGRHAAVVDVREAEGRARPGRRAPEIEDEDEDGSSVRSFAGGPAADLRCEKDELISRVGATLMQDVQFSPQAASGGAQARAAYKNAARIASLAHAISLEDGEFVLKLALYVRRDLNIRRTAAVLVALSAFEPKCQPFLRCYMRRIICLPSDWLSIANIAVEQPHLRLSQPAASTSHDAASTASEPQQRGEGSERRSLPNALRRALVATFTMFDDHSLAKYNTERASKRRRKKLRMEAPTPDIKPMGPLTFKDHIRRLHISQPAYAVCCLLGKRYPDTEKEFRERGLDEGGTRAFDPQLRGRRMRLPTPVTWERQVSMRGNRGTVWDELIANNHVPFMAMLRNLRNIIRHKCSENTHAAVIRRLLCEEQVLASRQFPYRFLSAFKALEDAFVKDCQAWDAQMRLRKKEVLPDLTDNDTRGRLLRRYNEALDRAAEISMRVNIPPIRGTSLVILYATSDFVHDSSGGQPQFYKAVLLAVALKYACEHCVVLLARKGVHCVIDADFRREDGLLHNVKRVKSICEGMGTSDVSAVRGRAQSTHIRGFPYAYLDDMLERRVNLQSLVVMGLAHSCYSGQNDAPSLGDLPVYLERMRRTCNEDLLFISLQASLEEDEAVSSRYRHKNDVLLTGFSDAMLRFVAERVSGGPRRYVERADEVYDVHRAAVVLPGRVPEKELQTLKRVLAVERGRRAYNGSAATKSLSEGGLTDTQGSSAAGRASAASTPPPSSPLQLLTLASAKAMADPARATTTTTTTTKAAAPATPIRGLPPERGFLSTHQECRFFSLLNLH